MARININILPVMHHPLATEIYGIIVIDIYEYVYYVHVYGINNGKD